MGGIHVGYRKTRDRYVAVASTIKLPVYVGEQKQSAPSIYDGVYPEFFHGFYYGSYGIDVGIVYKDGGFRICRWAFSGTVNGDQWASVALSGVNKGDTVILRNYLQNGKLISKCEKNGVQVGLMENSLSSGAYNTFSQGAVINREMAIAANRYPYVPTGAYFGDTYFSKSSLTKTNGTYVALDENNSRVIDPYADEGSIPSNFKYSMRSYMEGNFVTDKASADCRG